MLSPRVAPLVPRQRPVLIPSAQPRPDFAGTPAARLPDREQPACSLGRHAMALARDLGSGTWCACTPATKARASRLAFTKEAAMAHRARPHRELARHRGASSNCLTGSGPRRLGCGSCRASRSPRGRRARHAGARTAALKERLVVAPACRVPRLFAPLPSVATPDNPRGLSAAARFGPRGRAAVRWRRGARCSGGHAARTPARARQAARPRSSVQTPAPRLHQRRS